ncbi:MAG: LacI family transcriptional regulator [Thiomonas sp.]|nr:LacI family transcriptional regulator [Thiomonas sp.]
MTHAQATSSRCNSSDALWCGFGLAQCKFNEVACVEVPQCELPIDTLAFASLALKVKRLTQCNLMPATLDDVAKAAGVSTATVSYVINGSKPISAGTRAKVEAAIAELNYRPSPSARTLRTGQHQMLGLLLPDLANPFFPALAQAVAETARELGYGLMLSESGSDSASEDQALSAIQQRVDGIVWVPETREPETKPYRPTVIIDRAGPDLMEFDSVSSDHRLGGRLLARKIRELGHRRIGLLAGPSDSVSGRLRREALCAELGGIEPEWVVEVPYASDLPKDAVAQLRHTDVTLIIAANDAVAIGAMRVLKAHGRRVPEDISLIGFDDIPWACLVDPPLSTISQPVRSIGRSAVELLHRRLDGRAVEPTHLLLPVNYVARGSTRALVRENDLK